MSNERDCVLVIDDDGGHRELLRASLATHYQVITASGGLDGYTLACEHRPAVILLDLVMPVVDGFTLMRKLNSNPVTRVIPIVVVTGMSAIEAQSVPDGPMSLEALGAAVVLRKPCHTGEILDAVHEALRVRGRHAQR